MKQFKKIMADFKTFGKLQKQNKQRCIKK